MLWHTRNENDIIKYLKARKRGSGADGIDQSGTPFEVRESRKVPYRAGAQVPKVFDPELSGEPQVYFGEPQDLVI